MATVITAGWSLFPGVLVLGPFAILCLMVAVPLTLVTFLVLFKIAILPLAKRVRKNRHICAQAMR